MANHPTRRWRPCVALLAASLAACAGLRPPASPSLPQTTIPTAWHAAAPVAANTGETPSLAEWWQKFNDPALTTLITQALQASTDVRAAQAAVRQARALRDVKAAALQPALSASASGQRSKSGRNDPSNLFQAGFDASWEPDVFGATRSGVAAAEADAQASATTLADAQVSIAAEVAVSYLQLRGYQERLRIARDNYASQGETLQLTRWRTQAGLATSLDVEQARATNEQTRAQIPALESAIVQSENSLAVLTGKPPGTLHAQLNAPQPLPAAPDALAISIPAEALRQRPDVRTAEHRVSAAAARVTQADAARYPSFQLSGSLGLSALTLGSLTGSGAVVSALLGSISLPIADGGAIRAQVRAQEAALDQARVDYQAVVLTALKDVENALVSLSGTRERLAALRAAAEAAGNASLLARHRYASGLIDFQVVLDTQRTLLSTQDSVAVAETDLGTGMVSLYKALGGGWQAGNETSLSSDATRPSGDEKI